jgi:hypothetical protein
MPMITIGACSLADWQGPETGIFLLIYTDQDFTAQSGAVHPRSVRENAAALGTFYKSIALTVAAGALEIPQVQLDSTTDSPDNPGATYSAAIWDSNSAKVVQRFGTQESFPLGLQTPTTWATIFAGEAND